MTKRLLGRLYYKCGELLTTLIYQDTLSAVLTYLENDSIGQLVERSDSIDFVSKFSHEKQMKWAADALKKWKKEQEKNKKKGL